MNIGELKQLQSLPMEYKLKKTIRIVEEFMLDYEAYVSIGGADSYALNHMLESHGIFLPKASISRTEPYGNNKINAELDDITFLRPEKTKKEIISDKGYPIISKSISMAWNRWLVGDEQQKHQRLWGYMGDNGKIIKDGTIPIKYHNLVYAPFELTESCCQILKKKPLKKYDKLTGRHPITGELAEESRLRLKEYLKHGCIMHDKKTIKCTPLGFWTQQDLFEYRLKYQPKLSEEYIDIVEIDEQQNMFGDKKYKFSGEQRTGCDICTFGIAYDMNRFKRMHDKEPLKWSGMMRGGKWVECEPRLMILKPNTEPVMFNKKWIPSSNGYGYMFVLKWLNGMFNLGIDLT